MANVWLVIIFLIPIAALVLLRVNAVFAYLGLCLGYVLSQFDGGNKIVNKLAGTTKVIERLGGSNDVRLILLLLPAVLLMLAMYRSTSGGWISLNLVPAIAVGLLTVITVVPLLPLSTAVNIMSGSLWIDVTKYEGAIVGLSALIVVVFVALHRSKIGSSSKSLKHHKSKA